MVLGDRGRPARRLLSGATIRTARSKGVELLFGSAGMGFVGFNYRTARCLGVGFVIPSARSHRFGCHHVYGSPVFIGLRLLFGWRQFDWVSLLVWLAMQSTGFTHSTAGDRGRSDWGCSPRKCCGVRGATWFVARALITGVTTRMARALSSGGHCPYGWQC